MKNVLLLANADLGQEARLQVALDVTRAIDGHLTCLDVIALPPIAADPLAGPAVAMVLEDERTREDANCLALRDRLAREDIAWDLHQVTDEFTPAIEDAAQAADLVVLSSRIAGNPVHDPKAIAGQVVIGSGRPVLAVPDGCRGIDLKGTALVAWDGSQEADRSLRAALPLLQMAEEAVLFEAERVSQTYPADVAAQYLARNGIGCRTASAAVRTSVGDAILQAARDARASYIVMGAYGHSRTREALFGGVTRSLLETSDLPLFLAH